MSKTKVVLIADDNEDQVESLALLLSYSGFRILTATDGQRAFEIAERERPYAAVLDLGMPGRNGFEVARAIRHEHWGPGMLLIALTGWADDADTEKVAHAFNHVLIKPAPPDALEKLLSNWAP